MQGVAKNELYPVWATFMLLLFGGANSVSVQKLEENRQWLKLMLDNTIMYPIYFGSITGYFIFVPGEKVYNGIRYGALLVLIFLLSMKSIERLQAMALATDPRSSGSLTIKRFMKYYALATNTRDNPRSMQGFNYLVLPLYKHLPARPREVDIQRARHELITLEKIWWHSNGILSVSHPAILQLKDMCLSFALFRLAVRRYFGYACTESEINETRDLVLQGLLPRAEEEDCERAFQVIEVELAFFYDFFFTKYAIIMHQGVIQSLAISLFATMFVMALGIYSLIDPNNVGGYSGSLWKYGLVVTEKKDIIITKVVLCALAIFQLLEILLFCSSDWAKVSLVCKYITKSSWQNNTYIDKLLLLMGKFSLFMERHKWFHRWEHKIGQYSFLDSFYYPGRQFLEKYSVYMPIFWEGRKPGKSIPVPIEVKKAIAWTLKDSNGQISDGAFALEKHGMSELYWACQTNEDPGTMTRPRRRRPMTSLSSRWGVHWRTLSDSVAFVEVVLTNGNGLVGGNGLREWGMTAAAQV
ncbi:hypothetical protein PR202_gb27692 [Eleusine coracana subsp. coracana]|uniref:DUF4220 domain-containing protein n=1 Tax=Eleusine coracana subsp. coracana TaxID=191504 RepID=A0AAV5FV79_ELECO|nr:hypothetical protein PR202_gb27692 [Eleusine coracana subsp. coracana]